MDKDVPEIKAVIHNGEVYLNAKDVVLMMQKCSLKFLPTSVSVVNFVRRFILELIK